MVAHVGEGQRVLDIAGGTGDLSLAFAKKVGKTGQCGPHRHQRSHVAYRPRPSARCRRGAAHLVCDAERLPFADGHFDVVSVAFGLRNMTHKDVALAEMNRVLKPGGKLLVLEFSKVAQPLGKGVRLVFVQGPAPAGQAGGGRRRQLPLPGGVHSHAPGQEELKALDETNWLWSCGLSTTSPAGLWHCMLESSADQLNCMKGLTEMKSLCPWCLPGADPRVAQR
jgi:demethylmenaquinone methyltransferase/2-methoxy-6-polyprenyl-1,4-benzoquinol methylase